MGDRLRVLDALFGMRLDLGGGVRVAVTAYDVHQFRGDGRRIYDTHHAITFRAIVTEGGKRRVVWPAGEAWIGIPAHASIDGHEARAAVLSSLAMKPGDTDAEFFEGWTDAQIAFGEAHGDAVAWISEERFGAR